MFTIIPILYQKKINNFWPMYLIIALLTIIISFKLHQKAAGSLEFGRLNMISWVFYFHLFFQYFLAALLVIYGLDNHYLINKVQDPQAKVNGFYAIMYTMIAMPAGMMISNLLFRKRMKSFFDAYTRKPIAPLFSRNDSYIRIPLYVLSGTCVLSVCYVFAVIGHLPVLDVIRGKESVYLLALREEVGREFTGNIYVRNLFAIALTPIMSYIAYGYYRMTHKLQDRCWFLVMLFFSILVLTYNLAKAPVLTYMIGFFMFRVLEKGRVKTKQLVILGVTLIVLLVIMYVSLSSNIDTSTLFRFNQGILGRMLLSQSSAVFLTFDLFPRQVDHVGLTSLSDVLSNIFDWNSSERSARLLMEQINPAGVEDGTAGVFNTLFIAEAYANFGWPGLLIAPLYVGMIIQALYILFLSAPKTPLLLGLFVYFSYQGTVSGGFNDYIYNAAYFMLAIVILALVFFGKYLRETHQPGQLPNLSLTLKQ